MTWTIHLPLVAIPRGIRPDEVPTHIQALVNTGFNVIEIPLSSPGWAQNVQLAACTSGDHALIGTGTVPRLEDVDLMVVADGKLVVTSNTYAPVIRVAAQVGLVTCIGCMTATEAFAALDTGAQALKIFPAGALGPGHVYALRTVLSAEVPIFAVGDITPENLADYLVAGCIGTGPDNDLYRPGQPIERTAERACALVAAYRSTQSNHT